MALYRPRSTTDLADALGVSAGGVSQHLSVLREAGPRPRSSRRAGGALPALAGRRRPGRRGVAARPYRSRTMASQSSPSTAVLVTGCSSGIGRATARAPRRSAGTPSTPPRGGSSRSPTSRPAAAACSRSTSPTRPRWRAAVAAVEAEHGAVGALVNNAGYSQSGAVESVPMDEVRRQFETNVFGLVRMCQLVLPAMRAQRSGRIVNVTSMGGQLHLPGRRLLPRHQVRGGGDQRRAALRGRGLRRRRRRSSSPGSIRTEFGEAAADRGRPTAEAEGPYGGFNAAVAKATHGRLRARAPRATSAARPRPWPRRSSARSPRSRRKIRYRVTPSARVLIGQRALMTDGMWDRFVGTQFPRPGAQ